MLLSKHSQAKTVSSSICLWLLPSSLQFTTRRSLNSLLDSVFCVLVNSGLNAIQFSSTVCQMDPHEFIPALNCKIMLAGLE